MAGSLTQYQSAKTKNHGPTAASDLDYELLENHPSLTYSPR